MQSRVARCAAGILPTLLLGGTLLQAQQAPLTLVLRSPLPNQLKMSDLWGVTITYPTFPGANLGPMRVYLVGMITETSRGIHPVLTATSEPFLLQPGVTVLTGQNISMISPIQVNYQDPRYQDALTQTGQVPTGDYQLCVRLMVPLGGVEARMAAEDCLEQPVELTSQPQLISPADGDTVDLKFPVFTWTPPVPMPRGSNVRYTILIVEQLGRQSADAAVLANPAWYEQENLIAPLFQYSPGARALEDGHRYAWTVYATSGGAVLGQSQVWSYSYVLPRLPVVTTGEKKGMDVLQELLRSCTEEVSK